jgi:hypothetical protein
VKPFTRLKKKKNRAPVIAGPVPISRSAVRMRTTLGRLKSAIYSRNPDFLTSETTCGSGTRQRASATVIGIRIMMNHPMAWTPAAWPWTPSIGSRAGRVSTKIIPTTLPACHHP